MAVCRDTGVVVALTVFFGCADLQLAEAQCLGTTPIVCGEPVDGTLNNGECREHSFSVSTQQAVSITWRNLSGGVNLDIIRQTGQVVKEDDPGGSPPYDLEPDTYFLRFAAGLDNSSYRFEVVFLDSELPCVGEVVCGLPEGDGKTMEGGEQDVYAFSVSTQQAVSVTWGNLAGSVALDIFDGMGNPVRDNDPGNAAPCKLASGTYFLRFAAGLDNSSYRFEVVFLDGALPCVGQVTCGVPGQTTTINHGEQDVYSVTSTAPVSVTWGNLAGSVALDIFDGMGNPVSDNDPGNAAPLASGTYFLRFAAGLDNSSYRFEVVFLDSSLTCVGQETCDGNTINHGEQDVYSFSLTEGREVKVTWENLGGSVSLDIFDESRDFVSDNDPGNAAPYKLASGTYFLRFAAGLDNSSYRFTVSGFPFGMKRVPEGQGGGRERRKHENGP